MFTVGVFAGWQAGEDPLFRHNAERLGQALAERQMALVSGGTVGGLLGVVAEAAVEQGGQVTSVVPAGIWPQLHFSGGRLETVTTLGARIERMAHLAEAFVVLPGGVGTLHELFAVLAQTQVGEDKPLLLFNLAEFFTPLLTWLDTLVIAGFVLPSTRRRLRCVSTLEQVLAWLEAMRSTDVCEKGTTP
jgi:uncharacterized protein (TIGR00730 family)